MPAGPVVIAYDHSPAAEHAVREAGTLLSPRSALVLVVSKTGLGFELIEHPTATLGLPPAALDIRTALDVDRELNERAQRLAQQGAALAREAGFEAEGLAVADEFEVPVGETIVRVARERDAEAVVIGAHDHGGAAEIILGSTSRDVIRQAPCPVVVVRRPG